MPWKNYFYFTKKEKIGIITFFSIIVFVFLIKFLIPSLKPEPVPLSDSFEENGGPKKSTDSYSREITSSIQQKYTLCLFDPNTVDSLMFIKLGIKSYVIKNIFKYRRKGGKFKKAEDFSKVYGLSVQKFEELRPYIKIEDHPFSGKTYSDRQSIFQDSLRNNQTALSIVKQDKYPLGIFVDIAIADTSELKKIPSIGSSFAKRIVKYREILGGYHSTEQVKEVYGISLDLYEKILPWLKVEEKNIISLRVNEVSLERLKSHPYFNFYQAKAIIELRRKKGKLQNLNDLSLLEEFSEDDFRKINPYLSFE